MPVLRRDPAGGLRKTTPTMTCVGARLRSPRADVRLPRCRRVDRACSCGGCSAVCQFGYSFLTPLHPDGVN